MFLRFGVLLPSLIFLVWSGGSTLLFVESSCSLDQTPSCQRQQQQQHDDGNEPPSLAHVQSACFEMKQVMLYEGLHPIQDQMFHFQAFNRHLSGTRCAEARQLYSECWWCSEWIKWNTATESYNFCTFLEGSCEDRATLLFDHTNNATTTTTSDSTTTTTTIASSNSSSNSLTTLPLLSTTEAQSTCHELFSILKKPQYQTPSTRQLCERAEASVHLCPEYCSAFTTREGSYLGAETIPKRRALLGVARMAAALSILGATYVIGSSVNGTNRRKVYHQLMACMGFFDLVSAVAWGLATAPIPAEEGWGPHQVFKFYGAAGNWPTCTAQGFFVQLGFGSVFCNVSLSIYYKLAIVHNWREQRLRRIRPLLLGLPTLLALVLACIGIPEYSWFEYGCHLVPPPWGEQWPMLALFGVPLVLSIALIFGIMIGIYWHVRRTHRTSLRWSMSSRQDPTASSSGRRMRRRLAPKQSIAQKVFAQCVCYCLAFCITWPILFSVYFGNTDQHHLYGFSLAIVFVAPLQGFSNCLVYLRPKILEVRERRLARRRRSSMSTPTSSSLWLGGSVRWFSSQQQRSSLHLGSSRQMGLPRNAAAPERGLTTDGAYVDPSVQIALLDVDLDEENEDTIEQTQNSTTRAGEGTFSGEDEAVEEETKEEETSGNTVTLAAIGEEEVLKEGETTC